MGSDFLFTSPSFASGIARLVDLLNELDDCNHVPTSAMADAVAARVDWQAVGGDLASAMSCWRIDESSAQLRLFAEKEPSTAAG